MKRRYVDIKTFESRNMAADGNIDYRFWHDKSHEEKIKAAGIMTAVAFNEPDFFSKKLDRSVFTARKHQL